MTRFDLRDALRLDAEWPRRLNSLLVLTVAVLSLATRCALVGPVRAAGIAVNEPVDVTVCRSIEAAARAHGLPVEFLTRLIWQESSFRPGVVSPAGAQGIAQFMPGTATERGLADPFDPEKAIPKAAELLGALRTRFGNLGLAAAAYNAGGARVAAWLGGRSGLPMETRDYVRKITRRSVEAWQSAGAAAPPAPVADRSCLQVAALIRTSEPKEFAGSALAAPWGVQLAGSFSKAAALAAFDRSRRSYVRLIGDIQPMILGGRLRSRGFSPFYRVRVPAASRRQANALCQKILHAGGACAVLRS